MWRSAYVREIKKYQRATDNLVPRAAMHRLIREVAQTHTQGTSVRFNKEALERIHVEAEEYVRAVLSRANNYTVNAKRCTVRPRDIKAAHNDMLLETQRLRAAIN